MLTNIKYFQRYLCSSFYFRHAKFIFRIVIIFVLYFLSIDVWLIYVYISQFTKLGFNTRQARYTKENYRYWRTKNPIYWICVNFFIIKVPKILSITIICSVTYWKECIDQIFLWNFILWERLDNTKKSSHDENYSWNWYFM